MVASSQTSSLCRRLAAVVLWLGGSAFSLTVGPIVLADQGEADGGNVRVMTYNIRYLNTRDGEDVWPNRRDKVFETVNSADIVGLQEVVHQQLAEVRAACEDFEWYGVGRDDGKQAGESCPIGWRADMFSKLEEGTFWLSPTPEKVGSKSWDAALPRIASWVRLNREADDAEFIVVNTHFDHVGKTARKESAALIRKWILEHQSNLPVVLLGDFNALATDPPLEALLQPAEEAASHLRDARAIAEESDPGPDSTWNGFKEIVGKRRIDFVIVNSQVAVKSVETLDPKTEAGRFASDHLPVLAKLQLKNAPR